MNNNQNRSTGWVIGFLVVVVVLGGYFAFTNKTPPASTQQGSVTPTPTQIAGTESWVAYSGTGYSFKYPSDFTVDTSGDAPHLVIPVKTYFHTILADEAYITVYPPSTSCAPSQGENFEATTTLTSIDGSTVSKSKWSGVGAGQLYVGADYTVMKDGMCYEMSLYTHSANGAGLYFSDQDQIARTDAQHAQDMTDIFTLSDKIASTFQFTSAQ